ncbi:MAG: glycosyltransferase [Oscillospiraceae bacterium]|nr:glycosyltransferase [Oscillospiraceae bacterium]
MKCTCCGYYLFSSCGEAFFEICEICSWQYEETSHVYPDKPSGGANGMLSLNEARKNYKNYGCCEERFKKNCRPPREEELPENNE